VFSKLVGLVPRDCLVYMYKHMPFNGLKNWLVYRAQNKFLVAVLGIFTNEAGQILLLKHVYREEPWGIPGGWMELEKPELALERELKEETGLSVKSIELVKAIYGTKPNRVDLIFRGRVIEGDFKKNSEISEIMYCTMDDWPDGLPLEQRKLIKEFGAVPK
jgi:ADP-ribose pyrophosphatase YjhB (NUDIX family)